MNDSLSIIVPVRNVEATLAGQIAHLLELLPDLTSWFEVVVVDDASLDHTVELVRELASQYPQLRLIRHRDQRGLEAAVRTGLQWAQGRTVLVHESLASLSSVDLRRLWSRRHDEELVIAPPRSRPGILDPQLLDQLNQWRRKLRPASESPASGSAIHMIRRDAVERLLADNSTDDELTSAPLPDAQAARADASHGSQPPQAFSAFLRHLKNVALGE